MTVNFAVLDNACAKVEHVLNKVGWIPYVSWVSGCIRVAIGKIMFVAGFILAAIKRFQGLAKNNPALTEESRQYVGYAMHGFANICRGLVEMFPFINLICLIYDAFIGRFAYSQEILERGVRPLNPYHYQFQVVNF